MSTWNYIWDPSHTDTTRSQLTHHQTWPLISFWYWFRVWTRWLWPERTSALTDQHAFQNQWGEQTHQGEAAPFNCATKKKRRSDWESSGLLPEFKASKSTPRSLGEIICRTERWAWLFKVKGNVNMGWVRSCDSQRTGGPKREGRHYADEMQRPCWAWKINLRNAALDLRCLSQFNLSKKTNAERRW